MTDPLDKLLAEMADALEHADPQPIRDFFAHFCMSPKERLDRALGRTKGPTSSAAFDAAYRGMLGILQSLCRPPFNLGPVDYIIGILNRLNRAKLLTDDQKTEAVRVRHALNDVKVDVEEQVLVGYETIEYEAEEEVDSGGASGGDPCPPTRISITKTENRPQYQKVTKTLRPASLDF